ncbi:hypothetical protein [Methanobrevibacter arboriphilus]|uniref:hypothetical protein n=1 Tax=Methanobrevibacter arboriphilus TaxID=39441 RepID=UPI0006D1BFA1|nr:hypothetical protein [Methanobrevibacter arboriphilus]
MNFNKFIMGTSMVAITFLIIISLSSATAQNPVTITNTTSGGINGTIENESNYDTIYLDPGVYSGNENNNLVINRSISIIGNTSDARNVVINGSNTNRLFYITNTGSLTLINLTIANGYTSNNGGGGIYQENGNLTIQNSIFQDNYAQTNETIQLDLVVQYTMMVEILKL